MSMRRKILMAVGAGTLCVALPSFAQQQPRVRRIGYLSSTSVQNNALYLAAFRERMAALGWADARDYIIDARYANGVLQAVAGLADELIATRPDLLLTPSTVTFVPLAERTREIPIVFAIAQDPLEGGFAASLQRPGGNVTGLTTLAPDLAGKNLQLLKLAFPRVAHVAVLIEPDSPSGQRHAKEAQEAAALLKVRATVLDMRHAGEIGAAFKRGAALGVQAYFVPPSTLTANHRQTIVDSIARARVPAIFGDSPSADAGGLMLYAPPYADNYRRAAAYVDRIFKGAKPGDLPIEQPTKFEFVLNMKTAKALGLTIPDAILLRADRVIE